MDWTSHYKMCEGAAMGEALMQLLASAYCCEPTEKAIKKVVYDRTDCGAWIEFTEKGVQIGSTIENSDAATQSFDIGYNGDDDAFMEEYWRCLQLVEDQADELWHAANDDNEYLEGE